MDPKRGNARQGASKTSVASRHAAGMPANTARKYGSEVSLTPSQAKQSVDNPRKSPLDALSRMTYRQDPFQRRSGLQDVDDSFLASNAFARPARLRHSGLEGNMSVASNQQPAGNAAVAPIRVASGQEAPPQMQMQYQQQQQPSQMQQSAQQLPPQAAQVPQQSAANLAPAPVQLQQQQQQQQQQQPPVQQQQQQQLAPATVVPAQQPQQPLPQQQAPQYVQPPAAGQPTRHDHYPTGRAHLQHQHQHQQQQDLQQQQLGQQDAKAQAQAQAQAQMQQQQQQQPMLQQQQPPAQMSPRKYQQLQQQQQQQQGYSSQAANAVPPAAEMCTTCPNCQTTIYLVRTPELGHGDAGMPMQ
ncbi:GATA zinc finger domain-containing protein 10 [Drosophila hydei]|uniref:GATA zinc finger domain-containing protein 10 n=1 Tax=Drosophila hydei TaxID=7224 RepID=A0A6J1MA65_DROHY|nr:GATA zinc finger domain-containing protein 10 [Drosophila hydei]